MTNDLAFGQSFIFELVFGMSQGLDKIVPISVQFLVKAIFAYKIATIWILFLSTRL
jgi:hypothetical protein